MTIAEKILSVHVGKKRVNPGEFVSTKVDLVFANDLSGPMAIEQFQRMGADRVFDPRKIVLIADHFVPNKDVASAEQVKLLRSFAREQGITFFDTGRMGIEHALLPEQGFVLPGEVVVGGDSHTCTYGALGAFSTGMGSTDIAFAMAMGEIWMKVPPTIKLTYHGRLQKWVGGKDLILNTIGDIGVDGALYAAIEFTGEAIDMLSMDGRFTMANMVVEAGAKAGLFRVDDKTLDYLKYRAKRPYSYYEPDSDAEYAEVIDYDVSSIEPQVALPHSPANTKPVSQIAGIEVDQAVIGSCTNGRLEDLRVAAEVLRGRKVHPRVRCIIIPATQQIYLDALREGLISVFIEAGAAVGTPTCGPCVGAHMGILASGEICISTTNRNFIGRMGSTQAEIYLAGVPVTAASAVAGKIIHPEEVFTQ